METTVINLGAAEGYILTSIPVRPAPDSGFVRAAVRPLGNAIMGSTYTAQWLARAMAGEPTEGVQTPVVGGDRARLKSLVESGKLQPGYLALYDANIRVCRAFARDGGFEVARPWMPEWDPPANDPATYRTALATETTITIGVVAAVAAVAAAVAWWARGREEAQAAVESTRIRQQAAVGAATRVALAYVAAGKDPPEGFWRAVTDLGNGESARDWATPLAIAVPVAGAIGVGLWAALKKRPAKATTAHA